MLPALSLRPPLCPLPLPLSRRRTIPPPRPPARFLLLWLQTTKRRPTMTAVTGKFFQIWSSMSMKTPVVRAATTPFPRTAQLAQSSAQLRTPTMPTPRTWLRPPLKLPSPPPRWADGSQAQTTPPGFATIMRPTMTRPLTTPPGGIIRPGCGASSVS